MYFHTPGIFLRTTKYKDNILIANIFTREYGLVSLMVRKTAKKPLLTQPLTIVDLVYEMKKNNTIGFIKECSINYVYKDILFNNRKLNIILILSELMRKLLKEENVEMFDFIAESLKWLDNNKNTFDNFINYFLIKFCNISGIAPEYYGKNKNLEKAEHLIIKDGVLEDTRLMKMMIIKLSGNMVMKFLNYLSWNTMNFVTLNRLVKVRFLKY